ncbi:MAG: aspartate 1-decarboxylase, partial [Chloroflexota bacterium]
MKTSVFYAKLHQARVTDANIEYKGSIGIDQDLIALAGMYPYQKVLVVDLENGNRLETYIIPAERGSGDITLNGAAARLVSVGDRVIIIAFVDVEIPVPSDWDPRVVILDEENRVESVSGRLLV